MSAADVASPAVVTLMTRSERQRAALLLGREDLERRRVADQHFGLELVEPLDDLRQRVVDLEELERRRIASRGRVLNELIKRDAGIVAVDGGVERQAELAFGVAFAYGARTRSRRMAVPRAQSRLE